MFFARYRWAGKVVALAGFDLASESGRELRTALVTFSEYCQEKNRRGDGSSAVRLNLKPHEWAVLAGILAPEESKFAEHLVKALKVSEANASKTLGSVREAALKLAEKEMPNLLAQFKSP